MYTLTCDPSQKLIRATLSGFFTAEEVLAFARDGQMAVANMGCGSGEHLMLVDTCGCALQAQDVVATFQRIIMDAPLKARRIAVVTGGSLSRMQTRRILVRDQAMMFDNAAAAERWLLTGDAQQEAA